MSDCVDSVWRLLHFSALHYWLCRCVTVMLLVQTMHLSIWKISKASVTPVILLHNFVAQLYCATELQYATAHITTSINRIN